MECKISFLIKWAGTIVPPLRLYFHGAGDAARMHIDQGDKSDVGMEYVFFTFRQSWNTARRVCRGYGGNLAILDSVEHLDRVKQLTQDKWEAGWDVYAWVGLQGNQSWLQWEGTCNELALSNTSLALFQDGDSSSWSGDKCFVFRKSDFVLDGHNCDHTHAFICERKANPEVSFNMENTTEFMAEDDRSQIPHQCEPVVQADGEGEQTSEKEQTTQMTSVPSESIETSSPANDNAVGTDETSSPANDLQSTDETSSPANDLQSTDETSSPANDNAVSTDETSSPANDLQSTDETSSPANDNAVGTDETPSPANDLQSTDETSSQANDNAVGTDETFSPANDLQSADETSSSANHTAVGTDETSSQANDLQSTDETSSPANDNAVGSDETPSPANDLQSTDETSTPANHTAVGTDETSSQANDLQSTDETSSPANDNAVGSDETPSPANDLQSTDETSTPANDNAVRTDETSSPANDNAVGTDETSSPANDNAVGTDETSSPANDLQSTDETSSPANDNHGRTDDISDSSETTSHENRVCRLYNVTDMSAEELSAILAAIAKALTLEKKKLSRSIRMKISAPDHRASSTSIGYVAVFIITIPVFLILVLDTPRAVRQVKYVFVGLKNPGRLTQPV